MRRADAMGSTHNTRSFYLPSFLRKKRCFFRFFLCLCLFIYNDKQKKC